MSETFDLEVLFDRLNFLEKVEKGYEKVQEGKVIFHEEVKKLSKQR